MNYYVNHVITSVEIYLEFQLHEIRFPLKNIIDETFQYIYIYCEKKILSIFSYPFNILNTSI